MQRHGPRVWAVCCRKLGHGVGREDVFQKTFLILLEWAGSLVANGSLAAWLHRVAANAASDQNRETYRRRTREENAAVHEAEDEAADPGPNEDVDILREEIACLPRKYQAALTLRYSHGLATEAVAAHLNWRPGTVYGRLSRGREMLRRRLEQRTVPKGFKIFDFASTVGGFLTTLIAACRPDSEFSISQSHYHRSAVAIGSSADVNAVVPVGLNIRSIVVSRILGSHDDRDGPEVLFSPKDYRRVPLLSGEYEAIPVFDFLFCTAIRGFNALLSLALLVGSFPPEASTNPLPLTRRMLAFQQLAEGRPTSVIAPSLGTTVQAIRSWRRRWTRQTLCNWLDTCRHNKNMICANWPSPDIQRKIEAICSLSIA
jgi:RNA polymerase sigma factor (sigma-70 family)